jgi:hypothetical protein
MYRLLVILGLVFCFSCSNDDSEEIQDTTQQDVAQLASMMSGTFSSEEQSIQDPSYFNISLIAVPIWEDDADAKWLYIEQAQASSLRAPYRQRVYRISGDGSGNFESQIYELPNPSGFIHAWEDMTVFDALTPSDLSLRTGCSVFLTKRNDGCFSGGTRGEGCSSSIGTATYATSEVEVCADQLISWDRGFDSNGNQAWGAENGGYIFKRQ